MRKSFYIIAFLITVALGSLLLLAFNQFQLYGKHEQVISQTEKIIFQYAIIREQIIEDIVEDRVDQLSRVSTSIEDLHGNIIRILDSNIIPAEYKFSFMQQIDLPGLVLLLRKTNMEQKNDNLLRLINEEARVIGERFMLLERLVLGYAKQKLVDFQLIIIGILAIVVFLITVLMLFIYRMLIMPTMKLWGHTKNILNGEMSIPCDPSGWTVVAGLAININNLLAELQKNRDAVTGGKQRIQCNRQVGGKINEVCSSADLYQVTCRALLCNPAYVLSWVGIFDDDTKGVVPVAADGSSTMTGEECQECFGALLASQEGEGDPVFESLSTTKVVTARNVLANAPKGPFKNTPMANGEVNSISLPITTVQGKTYGVLTVYMMSDGEMLDQEMEMLSEIVMVLAAKREFFVLSSRYQRQLAIRRLVEEQRDIIVFDLDKTGKVLCVESGGGIDGYEQTEEGEDWIGSQITDLLYYEDEYSLGKLQDALNIFGRYDFCGGLKYVEGKFKAILEPISESMLDDVAYIFVFVPLQKNVSGQPGNYHVAYHAAVGQFASAIAHEITDLSNGVINYAQMLTDEIDGEQGDENKKYLRKIISGGEKMAGVVEPLLVEHDDVEEVRIIVSNVLKLVGHIMRQDGISVEVDIQPVLLKFRRQYLQLILLTVFEQLRRIVNRFYPHGNPKKILSFMFVGLQDEVGEIVQIKIKLPGCENDFSAQNLHPEKPDGLWMTRELVKNFGGEMKFSVIEKDSIEIELLLPH